VIRISSRDISPERAAIYEAFGEASVSSWTEPPVGIFNSSKVTEIADRLADKLKIASIRMSSRDNDLGELISQVGEPTNVVVLLELIINWSKNQISNLRLNDQTKDWLTALLLALSLQFPAKVNANDFSTKNLESAQVQIAQMSGRK